MNKIFLTLFFCLTFTANESFAQFQIPFAYWRKKGTWAPTDLGIYLLAWYDASVANSVRTGTAGVSAAASGDPVSEWRDLSGNSYHAQQSLAGRMPTYAATSWTGSKPTISWDGVDNGLVITGLTWQIYSFGMVVRHQNVGGVRAMLTKRPAVSASFFWFIYNTTSGTFNWDQNGNRYNTGFVPNTTTNYVYTLVRPAAGSARDQYVNGTLSGTSVSNPDNVNSETLIIGNDYSAATRGANAYISELVIVSSNLPDPQRQSLEGYLAWKWGTVASLPAGHPYKGAPP